MSDTETEIMPEPDWLAAEPTARAKLAAIFAAVRRCQSECWPALQQRTAEPSGPHLSTTMAEVFIGQLLTKAAEREQIPPTDQNIRAVAHNTLTGVLPEHMRFSDRIRVSEAVAAAVEPLIRASERERVLRRIAAECHRRKWAFAPDPDSEAEDPTFNALHYLGNEVLSGKILEDGHA